MRKVKMNNKNLVEYLVGKLVVLILESLFSVGLVLGFFYVLGLVMEVIECHFWLMIPLTLYVIYLMLKMVSE